MSKSIVGATTPSPRLSERLIEVFLTYTDDLILLFEGDGTIQWASPTAERLFGVRPEDLVGRNGMDMIHPEDQERAFEAFSSIPGRGDSASVELRIIDLAGRVRWVEEVATNLLDEPEVGGVVGHLRDITARKEVEEAVRFQASLLDAVGQAVIARDLDGRTIYWNDGATQLYGWSAVEALGQPLEELISTVAEDRDRAAEANAEHAAARAWTGELRVAGKTGAPVPVLVAGSPVHDAHGRLIGTIAVSTDLTETIAQRTRVEEERRRLADAQASAHLGSWELDLDTGELLGSDELWRILGRPPSRLSRLEHIHPEDRDRFRDALREAADGASNVSCTHRIVRPDGVVRWVISRNSQLHSPRARILSGTMLDITERHEAEQALVHQATHDPLTGLANRRLVMDHLAASLSAGTEGDTVVVLVDLDDFRLVNDRIGHVDADEVLRRLGQRIAAEIPPGGMVGRLGGDEFVICVAGCDEAATAALVERVQGTIRRDLSIAGRTLAVESSAGVASAGAGTSAQTVLRQADAAVFLAKQAGRARWERYDDRLHEQQRRRSDLALDLRSALARGQVVTHFQPEVDLQTGRLFGFEALARWQHPELGMIRPDEFISIAEEAHLIGPLGARMLENATAALATWRRRRPDVDAAVAVNVSPLQLEDPELPGLVRDLLRSSGVPPAALCLEVTESTLMDVRSGLEALQRLHDLGVRIAIDDFGTGYSSFGRLKQLPVDFLKIDQSFVAGIGVSDLDDVIITTMLGLAASLGVEVIAEGVETDDQRRFLTELRCTYGQGYLWSRPLDLAGATALVDRWPEIPAG